MYSVLNASKLVVPPLPPWHLPRPGVFAGLDDATLGPVTLLAGGPSSGKTTLLTEWVLSRDLRAAWVSLEPVDSNGSRFWALVGESLERAGLLPWLAPDDRRPCSVADITERIALWASEARPVHVVLDDAHVLADPLVLARLEQLARDPVPGLRLVVAVRPGCALHRRLRRHRAGGAVVELRARDLVRIPSGPRPERVLAARTTR